MYSFSLLLLLLLLLTFPHYVDESFLTTNAFPRTGLGVLFGEDDDLGGELYFTLALPASAAPSDREFEFEFEFVAAVILSVLNSCTLSLSALFSRLSAARVLLRSLIILALFACVN
jgi:hypothetical protein